MTVGAKQNPGCDFRSQWDVVQCKGWSVFF